MASTPPPTDEVNALINIWYPDKARTAVTAQHKGGEVGHRARVAEYWTLFPFTKYHLNVAVHGVARPRPTS